LIKTRDNSGGPPYNFIMKTDELEEKETIPFFIIVIVVMIFLYAMTLYTNPWLRHPPALIVFSAGMSLHTCLHWMFRIFSRQPKRAVVYFCFQSLLASMLILYTGEMTLVFGLYLALLGEEAGLFRGIKSVVIIVLVNVFLIITTLLVRQSTDGFNVFFLVGFIPMILFVIIYVTLYSRQLEARLKAQELLAELEQANMKLSMSNARVEELTREKERQRIARELHDTLAQGLSGIILQLEAVTAYLEADNPGRAGEIIDMSMMKARQTLSEAREVIDDLRNQQPENWSLRNFIYAEAAAFRLKSGMSFSIDIDADYCDRPEHGQHLIKIIAEGLGNCAEHSKADNVSLRLSGSGEEFVLKISDDGKGFDPESVEGGHYGLLGMRERAQILGGELIVESIPGRGTELIVAVPGDNNEK